ncbi:hypothetical protein LZC95_44315 [Pendulispora brunnea]|uniref:Uncharacterized protein n=1 Tax=Pendulispora brunnea TaxID=2905690 RepID=A0ABZ2K434_9BACT
MRIPGMLWPAWLVAASLMIACGGSNKSNQEGETPASKAPTPNATDTTAASSPATSSSPSSSSPMTQPTHASAVPSKEENAGNPSVPAGGGAKTQRPFANTAQEATEFIDEALETRHVEVEKCVAAARERRKSPHAEIIVELGIDQEGTLIGVKGPKGQVHDKVLFDCIRDALLGAPFPRSKAGVITLKKTFSDQVIYRR